MKENNSLRYVFTFTAVSLGGTLLHFLFDQTGENPVAALFSGINESTWEHMKLFFIPYFFTALLERRFFREEENFWCAKRVGALTGLLLIPILFYTYNGAFGKSPDWLNISIFYIATAAAFWCEKKRATDENSKCRFPRSSFLILCLFLILFFVFTFYPPNIPLFLDPLTNTYGFFV